MRILISKICQIMPHVLSNIRSKKRQIEFAG